VPAHPAYVGLVVHSCAVSPLLLSGGRFDTKKRQRQGENARNTEIIFDLLFFDLIMSFQFHY
ncbi:MAG: hypothetical protein AAF346_23370, partial [Pseudomonadota bacterium]